MKPLLLLALSSLLLSACSLSPSKIDYPPEQAVWSEDDSEIAVVQAIIDPTNADRHQFQMFVRKPDGSDNRQVTDVRSEQIRQLYYMQNPDYVIAEAFLEGQRSRFDRITLDGNEITVMEIRSSPADLCPQATGALPLIQNAVLPSPDGQILAQLFNRNCGEIEINFLQARDLLAVDGYSLKIDAPAQATWHPQGHLVIALNDGKTAWQLNVEQAPASTSYPRCLYPTTSSSNIAADGRRVMLRNGQLKIHQEDAQRAFGCQ